MRIVLNILMMSFLQINMWGQTTVSLKNTVNDIKKSTSYVYAETTLNNEQEALDLAQELLYQRINEYIADKKKYRGAQKTIIINQKYNIEKITLPRGDMHRAFVYVKKSDIIPAENAIINNSVNAVETDQGATSKHWSRQDVIDKILTILTFNELKTQLAEMKKNGLISEYKKHQDLVSPEKYILVIFDEKGHVRAVLSEGERRKNLKTSTYDAINNYKGCGAVGIRL